MGPIELEHGLWEILETLTDYAEDLILVGGWVPYLHLAYGRAADADVRTSLTAEADVMLPSSLERGRRRPIVDILKEAGFRAIGKTGVIWARKPELGETIEFLQPHRGPALSRGRPAPVAGQPGLRALALDHLWILQAFTERLLLDAPGERGDPLVVRVPLLSAFALSKANTFNLRGGANHRTKAGKDLLYLRDIMAAGSLAVAVLAADLDRMIRSEEGSAVLSYCRRATQHMESVGPRFYAAAADILAERDGIAPADARADVEGHLADLAEILRENTDGRVPERR